MQHPLDLAVEFLDATTTELVDLILALTTTNPGDGPLPAVIEITDPNPHRPDGPLFTPDPLTYNGYKALPLTTTQNRTLRELLNLHHWAANHDADQLELDQAVPA